MEDEPASEIVDATYRGLCEHGYGDLPVQDVAAEAAIQGAHTQQVAVDNPLDRLYTTTSRYAVTHLFVDGPTEVTH